MSNIHTDKNDNKWYETLDEAKEDGYFPVKCSFVLEFYTLKGKTSKLLKENLEPIKYLYYTVFDPNVNLFYVRFFRAYPLEVLFFYRKSMTFSGDDEAVQSLRDYIKDGNVTLLFSRGQVDNTSETLKRLYRANLNGEGQLSYRLYIKILQETLQYEDYKSYGKNHIGSKTVMNQFEMKIAELWKQASETKTK